MDKIITFFYFSKLFPVFFIRIFRHSDRCLNITGKAWQDGVMTVGQQGKWCPGISGTERLPGMPDARLQGTAMKPFLPGEKCGPVWCGYREIMWG